NRRGCISSGNGARLVRIAIHDRDTGATGIGNINHVGYRVDCDAGGICSHRKGNGIVGGGVDHGNSVVTVIQDVDQIGSLIYSDGARGASNGPRGGVVGGAIDYRHSVVDAVAHVDLVQHRVQR